uniref:DUF4371 domain-containing protein n=1 Tax=Latimeria chalumnae TaxID=7897 RepID=H3A4M8_LATCH
TLSKKAEDAFTEKGYNNKKATEKFREHEKSDLHNEAKRKYMTKDQPSVMVQLNDQLQRDQIERWKMLVIQLSSLHFLLRQGMAIRGHDELQGNLQQLLLLRAEDDPGVNAWISNRNYLSHDIVNEMISLMGNALLRSKLHQIRQCRWYAIIADEATDLSKQEQMTICIRWVDKFFEIHKDCIGLVQLDATDAQYLTTVVKDILVRCMLPLSAYWGQDYDGAGNMAGIRELERAALYVHCFAHCLNLCLQDSTRQCIIIRSALDICMDIEKLVRYSAKRMATFEQFQKQFASEEVSIKPLCPTRWTVRTGAINAILVNYHALVERCQEINLSHNDKYGRIARGGGVLTQLEQFKVYFGLRLAHLIFRATEQTSKNCSLQEGLQSVELTGTFLAWQRTNEAFHLFYKSVVAEGTKFTGKPSLPRTKRLPKCLDSGTDAHRFEMPEAFFRHQYFEAFDITAGKLKWRFEQSMLAVPRAIENLLIS